MNYKISCLLTLFLGGLLSFSQETERYQFSLQEAVNYALEHNRSVQNAVNDIEVAKKQKWETTAIGLPQLNATVDYQNFLKQQVSLIPAEFFDGNPGEYAEVIFGTKQNVTAQATLSQLLFDGSYLVGLQSAKVYLEISKNAKQKTDIEVQKMVVDAYANVLLSEESITVVSNNIETLEKDLSETTKIYENGLTEEENVEQLQITLSGLQSSLKNLKRLKEVAYQLFNLTVGVDVNAQTILTDTLQELVLRNINLELLTENEEVANNIDYKIAENDKQSKTLLVKLEKSKALPSLNAFLNAGYAGYGDDKFEFLNSNQQWFGSSVFGLSLNIPVFSSLGRTAATQRAKINLDKAEINLKDTEQRIVLQIKQAKSAYQYAIDEYEVKKENLELAKRIEKKNQTKFFEGVGSSFDLRQAQTQLYSAQDQYLQSMLEVINKKIELQALLNNITIN